MFHLINTHLDAIGMYRLVTLSLSFLVICSLVLGVFNFVPYSALEQLVSLFVVLTTALITNVVLGKLLQIHVNNESAVITALIIFFLVLPALWNNIAESWIIALVTFLAILSKFIFVRQKQHLVNPAAFGVVLVALFYQFFPNLGYFESAWWIGQPAMFVPLVLVGTLLVIKLRRFKLISVFVLTAFIFYLFESWSIGAGFWEQIPNFWLSGPTLFLAFFMLTEPFTLPPTKNLQIIYAMLIGFLSQTTIFESFLELTPELALVIGNLLFFAFTLRQKLFLSLIEKREIAKNTFEFVFAKPHDMAFVAGQYMEWMLPHGQSDNRGIRRYFTIASAPSDKYLRIGVRFGEKISTYKTNLLLLAVGDKIIASQRAGDFTLPKDNTKKVAMVAGGIGITPFASQISEMIHNKEKRDTILFNCNNTEAEIAYQEILADAEKKLPINVVNILAKEKIAGCEFGFLTEEIIKKHAPDYLEREWYISGPPMMVRSYRKLLKDMKVPLKQIVTDFFPGLV